MHLRARFRRWRWLWAIIIALITGIVAFSLSYGWHSYEEVSVNEFLQEVDSGNVSSVKLVRDVNNQWHYIFKNKTFTVPERETSEINKKIVNNGIILKTGDAEYGASEAFFVGAATFALALILLLLALYSERFLRWSNQLRPRKSDVRFCDIAGRDDDIEDMQLLVAYLKDPQEASALGGKPPKGVLAVGPPGVGKTLMARAIAGEADVPFFDVSCSELVEVFAGTGPARIRDVFKTARMHAPCIVFMDEIDSLGARTSHGTDLSREDNKTMNQLLKELDGFLERVGILVIAATNRPDVLDEALLRPGRFDRKITFSPPDVRAREQILELTRKNRENLRLVPHVNLKHIAQTTVGFTGADLVNMLNEAALLASRRGKDAISNEEVEHARDTIMMGSENSILLSAEEKKMAAYHEAGHAVVALLCTASRRRIHKATIVPRGQSLGAVMRVAERDEYTNTKAQLEDEIRVLLGGRIAEELVFGKENITNSSANDIKVATSLAHRMVAQWGMASDESDLSRDLVYSGVRQQIIGVSSGNADDGQTYVVSEYTARLVDAEIAKIVRKSRERVEKTLKEKRDVLEEIARALLEHETLSGDELRKIVDEM